MNFDTPEIRQVLARQDITALYQLLKAAGWSQAKIAEAAGHSQSEVSEIMAGRRVMGYDVLVRISEGLGIPRGWMGLSYGDEAEEPKPAAEEWVDEDVKRRAMFGVASLVLFGAPVLGEILELGPPRAAATPLPTRLASSDATALHALTAALRSSARAMGGGGQMISETANKALRLLAVPASEETGAEVKSAVAELHTLAGWTCCDSGFHDTARYHFAKSMEIAKSAGDDGALADALWHAGLQMIDAGADNDGLKALQLGLAAADWSKDGDIVQTLTTASASALARLGERESALRTLRQVQDFSPVDPFDDADFHYVNYRIHYALGDLDKAAGFASSAVRKWEAEGTSSRDAIESEIALADLHVRTGSSDGPAMAHAAIKKVAALSSVRARRVKLPPLVDALSMRGNSELARLGRQVMTEA
ncbi:MAG TPA: helix-turn-helix transcriptional regulator [Pseudonocardiaceae bacterium]|nr:helix-turn-helix transcriptional regulator [Pseudonocardiaceae bacterium]